MIFNLQSDPPRPILVRTPKKLFSLQLLNQAYILEGEKCLFFPPSIRHKDFKSSKCPPSVNFRWIVKKFLSAMRIGARNNRAKFVLNPFSSSVRTALTRKCSTRRRRRRRRTRPSRWLKAPHYMGELMNIVYKDLTCHFVTFSPIPIIRVTSPIQGIKCLAARCSSCI